jgi:hypothetical protein
VRVAWVTHHVGAGDPARGWLPGEHRGGGEMTDADWRAAAPPDVEVEVLPPFQWQWALNADRVVVTGTDLLTEQAMAALADRNPAVALHHRQTRSEARQKLLEAASVVILHTPGHEAVERRWAALSRVEHVLSPMRPGDFAPPASQREPVALWASRDHPLKGRPLAEAHARRHGMPFQPIVGQPRSTVLAAMAKAQWFIHLPLEFESEGRSVIEAVLSGCEVIANANVGITSYPRWRDPAWMAEQTSVAGERFWQAVLS